MLRSADDRPLLSAVRWAFCLPLLYCHLQSLGRRFALNVRIKMTTQRDKIVASLRRNPSFRLFLASSSVSMLGTRMTTIAFPMLVLYLTGSPVAAGWTAFAATAPSIFVYMPAGALVDRWHPRLVMVASELGRGIVISTVAIILLVGRPNIFLLIGLAIIEEILEIFSTLAERRYVSSLVAYDQAPSALVKLEARTHFVVLTGRPLGGFLFTLMPTLPFAVDALSFAFFACILIKIRNHQIGRFPDPANAMAWIRLLREDIRKKLADRVTIRCSAQEPARPFLNDIGEGLRWICRNRFARITVGLSAGTTLISQALIMVFLADAHSRHLSSITTGIGLAACGAGGAIGSMAASWLPSNNSRPWILIRRIGWFIALAILAIPTSRSFLCMTPAMAVLAFTGALGNVQLSTYLMRNAEEGLLARVTSVGRVLSFCALTLGPMLGGLAAQELSIHGAMLGTSGAIIILAACSFRLPCAKRSQEDHVQRVPGLPVHGQVPSRPAPSRKRATHVLTGVISESADDITSIAQAS
jgi:MFS family permease